MCSQNPQYVSKQHQENKVNFGHLDGICQTLPSKNHHTLLFLPDCVKAEKLLKQSVIRVLSTSLSVYDKLITVSYLEKFFKAKTIEPTISTISVECEKLQSLIKTKTTERLGYSFTCLWECGKHNPLGTPVGKRVHCFFQVRQF